MNLRILATGVLVALLAAQAMAQQEMRVIQDIQYATYQGVSPKLNQLDIYAPPGEGPFPVVVFIHGGSWRFGNKGMVAEKPELFTGAGYIFVSVNYRLSPEVQHPAHAQDCGKAFAWVVKNIKQYHGDPTRVYLLGHSSGAHLAALISTDPTYVEAGDAKLSDIKGTIVLDGAGYDIPKMVNSGELFAQGRYERAFGNRIETWKNASPTMHVGKGKGIPPFLIVHAGKRVASHEQAEEFGKLLEDAGVKVTKFSAPNRNHLTVNSAIGNDGDETTRAILEFLNSNGATVAANTPK